MPSSQCNSSRILQGHSPVKTSGYVTLSNKGGSTQDVTEFAQHESPGVFNQIQLGLSPSNSQHTYTGCRTVNSGQDVYAMQKDLSRPGTVLTKVVEPITPQSKARRRKKRLRGRAVQYHSYSQAPHSANMRKNIRNSVERPRTTYQHLF